MLLVKTKEYEILIDVDNKIISKLVDKTYELMEGDLTLASVSYVTRTNSYSKTVLDTYDLDAPKKNVPCYICLSKMENSNELLIKFTIQDDETSYVKVKSFLRVDNELQEVA